MDADEAVLGFGRKAPLDRVLQPGRLIQQTIGNVEDLAGADGENAGQGLARVMLETQHREGQKSPAQHHQQQAIEKNQPGCD